MLVAEGTDNFGSEDVASFLFNYDQLLGFSERLLRPIPLLPVHDWRLIGLDVNRGYGVLDIASPTFGGAALRPALKLGGSGRG